MRCLARWLAGLYPAEWRERYGDEFEALLEDSPPTPLAMLDVAIGALDAHLNPQAGDGGIAGMSNTPCEPPG